MIRLGDKVCTLSRALFYYEAHIVLFTGDTCTISFPFLLKPATSAENFQFAISFSAFPSSTQLCQLLLQL